jgi:hypothetical protein
MSLDASGILDAVVSHAAASGYLDRVNTHEPKSAPGNGLSAAVWVQNLGPAVGASGLQSTSGLLTVWLRVYSNMIQEPQDSIDPNVLIAVDALMAAYSGDFQLGGKVRNIDLLGQASDGLSAQAGYLEQDHKMYRVMTISIPMIINDIWEQTA